jgi:hypothetical protein
MHPFYVIRSFKEFDILIVRFKFRVKKGSQYTDAYQNGIHQTSSHVDLRYQVNDL